MNLWEFAEGEEGVVARMDTSHEAKKTLLMNGLCLGSIFIKNYSPRYAKLINIVINGRILSIRAIDAKNIKVVKHQSA